MFAKRIAVRTKVVILRYGVADSAGLHMFAASAGEVQCLLLFNICIKRRGTNSYSQHHRHFNLLDTQVSSRVVNFHRVSSEEFANCSFQVSACLIRVPTEIVKQRRQAGAGSHGLAIVRATISSEVVVLIMSMSAV